VIENSQASNRISSGGGLSLDVIKGEEITVFYFFRSVFIHR
jgi:hypothetical protein